MEKTYIDKIDDTICFMNYETSPIKKDFLLDNIEHLINEDNVPAIYITLKTNSPQMYYIVAEMTDFELYADELTDEQKVLLTKMVFDRQPFAKEFNTLYSKVKCEQILSEYEADIDGAYNQEKSPEESFSLGVKLGERVKNIPSFIEPVFVNESSSESESC